VTHDPRAPRLAATSMLAAGALLVLTGVNISANVVGQPGFSTEETIAIAAAVVFILVGRWANVERVIPELGVANVPMSEELDGFTRFSVSETASQGVNPTTATIISSILGESAHSDPKQVTSAIDMLSSGEFGQRVNSTIAAVESYNHNNANTRENLPVNDETGQTLERVLVEAVPLPGRENQPTVNPATIPGLEPNRVFVTSGLANVPLPGKDESPAATPSSPAYIAPALDLPELPDISEVVAEPLTESTALGLPELPPLEMEPSTPSTEGEAVNDAMNQESEAGTATPPTFQLPDLDDLFDQFPDLTSSEPTAGSIESDTVGPGPSSLHLPELPDLDDLF